MQLSICIELLILCCFAVSRVFWAVAREMLLLRCSEITKYYGLLLGSCLFVLNDLVCRPLLGICYVVAYVF